MQRRSFFALMKVSWFIGENVLQILGDFDVNVAILIFGAMSQAMTAGRGRWLV